MSRFQDINGGGGGTQNLPFHSTQRPYQESFFTQLISWFCFYYSIPYQASDICAYVILRPTDQPSSETLNLSITSPAYGVMYICLTSNSYYRNCNSLHLGDAWWYLSYDVFLHSKLYNLKPFSLNWRTRKERLLLLLVNSDSQRMH